MPALAGALLSAGLFALVQWSTPEECPGQNEFAAALDRHLDPRLRPDSLEIDVQVRRVASGYQLDLAIAIADRRRRHRVVDHDCAALVEFIAVLVATAIDPFALGGPAPVELGESTWSSAPAILVEAVRIEPRPTIIQIPRSRLRPDPVPASPPEPSRSSPPIAIESRPDPLGDRIEPEAAPPVARSRSEGFIALATGGVVGLFPAAGGSVELAGGLDRGPLRFAGGVASWFGGRFREGDDSTRGGNLAAFGPVLELCGVPRLRRVDFPLCASGRGGAEVGWGVGLAASSTKVRPWVAVGGDVSVRWRVGSRVALRLGIGVLASIVRPTWTTPNTSFTTPPVLGQLRLAVELIPRGRG
jgi:hypothetical protein